MPGLTRPSQNPVLQTCKKREKSVLACGLIVGTGRKRLSDLRSQAEAFALHLIARGENSERLKQVPHQIEKLQMTKETENCTAGEWKTLVATTSHRESKLVGGAKKYRKKRRKIAGRAKRSNGGRAPPIEMKDR